MCEANVFYENLGELINKYNGDVVKAFAEHRRNWRGTEVYITAGVARSQYVHNVRTAYWTAIRDLATKYKITPKRLLLIVKQRGEKEEPIQEPSLFTNHQDMP